MTFANPLPLWALLPIAAALVLVSWLAYRGTPLLPRRRAILTGLRLVTLILLLVLLMRPIARARCSKAKCSRRCRRDFSRRSLPSETRSLRPVCAILLHRRDAAT